MDTLQKLLEERNQVFNRRKARNESAEAQGRDFNEQEANDDKADCKKFEELSARIERVKSFAAQQQAMAGETHTAAGNFQPSGHVDQPSRPTDSAGLGIPQTNPGGLNVGDRRISAHTTLACMAQPLMHFANTPEGREDAYVSGQWMLATMLFNREKPTPQQIRARQFCRDRGIETAYDPAAELSTSARNSAVGRDGLSVQASMSEGSNFGGGYLVIPEFERSIIYLRSQFGYFRRNARNWPMGSDTLYIPRLNTVPTANWTTDTGTQTSTESNPVYDQVTLTAQELSCICKWSISLDMDAIVNLADILAGEISYAMAYAEDNAGFNGTGLAATGGIDGIANKITQSAYSASVYQSATSGHSSYGNLTLPDFHNVVGILPTYAEEFGGGPKWYISRPGFAASMETLQYAAGGNTVVTVGAGDYEYGAAGRRSWMKVFLGYPVELIPVLNRTLTAQTGAIACLFGNMYLSSAIGTRRGMYFYVSRDRYFENRQLAIIGIERVAINNHSLSSPPNLETQAGPVCALQFSAS